MSDTELRIWWDGNDDDIPSTITNIIDRLDNEQSYRSDANLLNLRLYSNLAILGMGSADYMDEGVMPTNRLTLNIVESAIEASKALISTNKPKIKFLTEGGDYKSRKKARDLTYFTSGQFYKTDVYKKAQQVFTDGGWSGTGFLKIFEKDGDIDVERVFPDEIIIDDVEAKYCNPRSLYQHKEIEKEYAKVRYPGVDPSIIDEAQNIREGVPLSHGIVEPISLVEAWHLPSKKGAKDGRHVIMISNQLILDEPWELDHFPFVVFRWVDRPMGFWGKGISEMLRGIQIEINMVLQKVQRHMNLASSKVFLEKGSKVNKAHLNNEEWGVVEYAGGRPPVFATIAAISPEYYNQIERLYQKAFEIIGISQMAAQAKKPAGLESGKAIREYNDIQTQRFLHIGQKWEDFYVEIANHMVALAKQIAKKNKDYKVLAEVDDDRLQKIRWKDVDPGEDAYRMKAWPASLLPDSPAGKLQTVQELGTLDPRIQPYLLQLLDYPDIEATMKRINAPMLIMEKIIGNILDGDKYIQPEPYMDLRHGLSFMQHAYIEAVMNDVEERKLDLIRRWMGQAKAILEPAEQAQMQAMQQQAMQQAQVEGMAKSGQGNMTLPGAQPTPVSGAVPGKI
jgi:hypothetical protein